MPVTGAVGTGLSRAPAGAIKLPVFAYGRVYLPIRQRRCGGGGHIHTHRLPGALLPDGATGPGPSARPRGSGTGRYSRGTGPGPRREDAMGQLGAGQRALHR